MIKSVITMTENKVIKKEKRTSNSNKKEKVKVYEHWHDTPPPNRQRYQNPYPYKKLYRSTRDKWLGGVCGGMAEYFNKDPVLIRILWVVLTIFSFGVGIIAYILFWIFVEKYPSYYTLPTRITSSSKRKSVHYHYYN